MTPRVRTAIQRIEQAFEAQNWDHPTLLTDAHAVAQYAKQAHVTIGGGDTAISQLKQAVETYRSERNALNEAMQKIIGITYQDDPLHQERFAVHYEMHSDKMPPGWRVVEAMRDIAVDAVIEIKEGYDDTE